ncbi:FAD-dependent oxidoreductase [Vibrio sp. FNV 38]|nr:FAD-dependent oxidoreductase [Vibrio sp. FNV 38]
MSDKSIAIIGGGVAGSTVALHLAEIGLNVTLIEKGDSLVSGPPICHLHAGGNLYREISTDQCIELLKQSLDTVRLFPHTLNHRPTIIAIPHQDAGDPTDLIPRLEQVKIAYSDFCEKDTHNQVLGDPSEYYQLFSREDLESLKGKSQSGNFEEIADWLIPVANNVDLDAIKFPVIAVQEPGWSVFRQGASAMLALEQIPNCNLILNSEVVDLHKSKDGWVVKYRHNGQLLDFQCDYLINASGYKTGHIDDMVQQQRERLVEFKAAYVTHWQQNQEQWPEVIFHGQRGTPNGMAQLTPYCDNIFQLHGMTKDITLFEGGLVESESDTSQPKLPSELEDNLKSGWETDVAELRTRRAIDFIARTVPNFSSADCAGTPLFGAQQIPGKDDTLRAADVSFAGEKYARLEIVKGSSALQGAMTLVEHWQLVDDLPNYQAQTIEQLHPTALSLTECEIESKAIEVAQERGYPDSLAKCFGHRR